MNKRIFLRYVAQNIAGMIGLSCYILVDTLFVSVALGASGLAALNLSITVFSVVTGIGQLAGIGGGTDFSLRRAEGRDAERSLPTALLCGGAAAFVFVLAGVFFAGPLSRLLGADETTFALTKTYVRMTLLFSPVYILCSLLRGFVSNDGAPNLAMLSMLASSGLNILLDYLFMFPLGMGMFGAVLATGLSACLSAPVLLFHFFTPRCTLRLSRRLLSCTQATVAALSLSIFALVFLFAQPLAGAFNHEGDARLLAIAVSGLRIYFAGYLFAGVNIAAAALLSAVGRPQRALVISLLRSCVLLVPAALLLSRLLSVPGVWLSFVVTEAACCVLSLVSVRAVQKA